MTATPVGQDDPLVEKMSTSDLQAEARGSCHEGTSFTQCEEMNMISLLPANRRTTANLLDAFPAETAAACPMIERTSSAKR